MKLRIRGNSIRLRLTRTEVARFGETGKVGESVEFGPLSPILRYEINSSGNDDSISARFEDNCLSIAVPAGVAENWIVSEDVGIEVLQPIGDNKFLRILIEKDFACLTPRADEDETDTFTHPLAKVTCG